VESGRVVVDRPVAVSREAGVSVTLALVPHLLHGQVDVGLYEELREKNRLFGSGNGHLQARGRCYDHNFLRFLPIFGEKIDVFLINQCYDHNFCKKLSLRQKRQYFR
jgi:hypothetical protein